MYLYKFDLETGEYLSKREASLRPNGQPILEATGHTPVEPPDAPHGYAPVWDGTAWHLAEDHRQKRDGGGVVIEGSGTPYWLPGDTWQSPARYMEALGPLPDEAFTDAPEKTVDELKQEKGRDASRAYEEALAATLTMPADHPSAARIAVESALFAVDDAEGLTWVMERLSDRKDELMAAIDACSSAKELAAIDITFPV